jgi:hypothetical protein
MFHTDRWTDMTKLVFAFVILRTGLKIVKVAVVHAVKAYEESSAMAVLILNQGARWSRVVIITSQPLCYRKLTTGPTE